MSKILALETSTELCSAALGVGETIYQRQRLAPREHTQYVMGQIDELFETANCAPKDLDAVAFGAGPGSFTGVRLATALAQGFAVAHNLPVLSISTLGAMAWPVLKEHPDVPVLTALDARLKQVYWGGYKLHKGELTAVIPDTLSAPEELSEQLAELTSWHGVGSGWSLPEMHKIAEKSVQRIDSDVYPEAQAVLELAQRDFQCGRGKPVQEAQPIYLRHPVDS